MSSAGNWYVNNGGGDLNGVSTLIVPSNYYRDKLTIQMRPDLSEGVCYLGFDQDAVLGTGVYLSAGHTTVVVEGPLSACAVYGIVGAHNSVTGGYQENLGICS